MNFLEQFPELIFEFLILFPLVEFADKMTTGLEDVNAKLQSSMAKVLVVKVGVSPNGRTKSFISQEIHTMLPAWSLKITPLVFIILL